MIRIQISEDALEDLNEGFLFYYAQTLRGCGSRQESTGLLRRTITVCSVGFSHTAYFTQ